MPTKACKKCNAVLPLNTDFFNLLSSGYWRGTCKTCMAKKSKAHYVEDPEKVKKRATHYAKLKKAAGGSYTTEDINAIRDKLNDKCAYCMTDLNKSGEIDHMIPISRGGNSDPFNLTLSCRACNRDKHNKTSAEFILWRKNLNLPLNIHFIKHLLNK